MAITTQRPTLRVIVVVMGADEVGPHYYNTVYEGAGKVIV
jgi:hypothetical protein